MRYMRQQMFLMNGCNLFVVCLLWEYFKSDVFQNNPQRIQQPRTNKYKNLISRVTRATFK